MEVVGFEDGERGSEAKECDLLPAVGKVRERDSSIVSRREHSISNTWF